VTDAVRAAILAIAVVSFGARADAHELGPTRVHVAVDARRGFEIALVGDVEALLTRLEALSGSRASSHDPDVRLRAVSGVLLRNLEIRFNGIAVTPDVVPGFQPAPEEESPPASGTRPGAIVLRGAVPHSPRVLTWQCGFLYGSYPVIVSSGERAVAWIQGTRVSEAIALTEPAGAIATVLSYVRLGVAHVVPGGLDHVLFVLGVFLLGTRPRDVVAQVSAFTLAHSLTLGLGLAGVLTVPAHIVEPLIALSIAYVAIGNVIESRVRRHRLAVVFAFGLLHGLGFAGVLSEIGVAPNRFFHALLGFNAGVEIGQLIVVAGAMVVAQPWRRDPVRYRRVLAVPASCALAVIGVCWTVIRIVA
jgi:hypothetical protein